MPGGCLLMKSAVCTLFGGRYHHYGLGALANSLFAHGFRGTIFAGYDGPLPPWAKNVRADDGYFDFEVADGLDIRFIPLQPQVHFSNYKPDFLLNVWNKHCPQAETLFYFDPDITIKCRWKFFEEWVEAGIAICHDVNNSMPDNHPIRYAWRKLLTPQGLLFRTSFDDYFNAGFIGVSSKNNSFLKLWRDTQILIQKLGADLQGIRTGDRTLPFAFRDQDALNIACMVTEHDVSPVGQNGMDFQHGGGGYVMSHAVGILKPWNKRFLQMALLHANPPSGADKEFFLNATSPVRLYPSIVLSYKRLVLLAASCLGRFMHRG